MPWSACISSLIMIVIARSLTLVLSDGREHGMWHDRETHTLRVDDLPKSSIALANGETVGHAVSGKA